MGIMRGRSRNKWEYGELLMMEEGGERGGGRRGR